MEERGRKEGLANEETRIRKGEGEKGETEKGRGKIVKENKERKL